MAETPTQEKSKPQEKTAEGPQGVGAVNATTTGTITDKTNDTDTPQTSAAQNSQNNPPAPQHKGLRLKSRFARLALTFFGNLGYERLMTLGNALGSLMHWAQHPTRHTIETNLALAFSDLPPEKRQSLARATLIDNCKLILELAYLWTRPATDGKKLIRRIHGEDRFDQALQDTRGLLLILPHLGNWELTNHYLMAKTPLTALYKPLHLPDVEAQVKAARSLGDTRMVPTNQSGVKELMRTLKKGGVSVILPDQSPPAGSGQFAPLFGVDAYTSPLVPKLLGKTNALCLCIFAERLPDGKGFDIHIEPASPLIFDKDPTTALRGLNASIENCITPRISQYLWSYKRYKIRPHDDKNPYDYPLDASIKRTKTAPLENSPLTG